MKTSWLFLWKRVRGCALGITLAAVLALIWQAKDGAVTAMDVAGEQTVCLPIIMYHSLLKDPQLAGPYVLSPAQFEDDLLYLKQHGYETVSSAQLMDFVHGRGELPPKPVMITFDDGQYNNLLYGLPLLQKYGMHAVLSPIGFKVDEFSLGEDRNPIYAYLSWEDISALLTDGTFEIGNHTYSLHSANKGRSGVTRLPGEKPEAHKQVLTADVAKMQQALREHCGYEPMVFAFPYGKWDKESQDILREMGFCIFLTCYERVNTITRDPECLLKLGRYNRPSGVTTDAFMEKALGNAAMK